MKSKSVLGVLVAAGLAAFTPSVLFADSYSTLSSNAVIGVPTFMVSQPVVSAGTGNPWPALGGHFVFGSPSINTGLGYNASNGTFTAPKAGTYLFSYSITSEIDSGHNGEDVDFVINGATPGEQLSAVTTSKVDSSGVMIFTTASNTAIFRLKLGDTISLVRTCCSDNQVPYLWRGNFLGYYIHS
jgi:hypothetical protein